MLHDRLHSFASASDHITLRSRRQWPATFCNEHYCSHHPPKKYAFTVHGLWPQRRDGTWPEFCDPDSQLSVDDIWDLLPDLEKAWPSWSSDDEAFWNHEWTRHGTCAKKLVGGQHSFFKAVLDLHEKLNVQAALESAGIMPSNKELYPVQDIKNAIEAEYEVMPHITCDGEGDLAEVWMCLNKKLKPIDCVDGPHPHRSTRQAARTNTSGSTPTNFNCNMVKIPTLKHRMSAKQNSLNTEQPAEVGKQQKVPAGATIMLWLPLLASVAVLLVAAVVVAAAVAAQAMEPSSTVKEAAFKTPCTCSATEAAPLLSDAVADGNV
eukprot:GHRR01012893.1.p1 GENE.GHRR01012893.1~~GHRR01012893.1.p1  ORF type:complete len:321 (+),score=91.96 GHRR01012893.1:250-1212(+)